ncbi:hypothetical protein Gotri_000685 [Gossypium trilobum]|uniref:Uncharacterized protein n=1 Tax=Gossypium trilobum TaxID=34281 RepID=A0A7J9FD23_9ROSI|nr:hypothetical protein [Gossypium trilobum]
MKNYFRAKGIMDDVVKFYPEFTEEEAQANLQGITQWGTVGGVCSRVQGTHAPSFIGDRERRTSLGIPSPKKGAYVKGITRKILLMAMATATMVVMGNHDLGRRNPRGKGTS